MSRKHLVPLNLPVFTSDPATAVSGDQYFNSSSGEIRVYNGSIWQSVSIGAPINYTGAAPITVNGSTHVIGLNSGANLEVLSSTLKVTDALTGIDSIAFDTTAGVTATTGQLTWNADMLTLDLGMPDGVTLQVGQEEQYPPTNNLSGALIPNGSVVMATGVQGDRLTIAKAVTNGTVGPEFIIGIATSDIAIGSTTGKITKFGYVNSLDTSAYTIGQKLYSDPNTPGALTATQPDAPAFRVPIAMVIRVHANTGRILVRMSGGSSFGTTDDNVKFTALTSGDGIYYNGTLWVNTPMARLNAANTWTTGTQTINTGAAATVGLIIKGATSQSVSLTQWKNVGGTVVAEVDQYGGVKGIYSQFVSDSATTMPLMVKGAASQTADLQRWQNSAGTSLAKVDASGNVTATSYNLSDAKFLIRKTLKKAVVPSANPATGDYWDLYTFDYTGTSLQGTFYIQLSLSGSGFGQNLTYTLPVGYNMDWLSNYGNANNPFNGGSWVNLTPLTFSPRHLMTGDYANMQVKVVNNVMYLRIRMSGALTATPTFYVYVQQSEEFVNASITELFTSGNDATTPSTLANFISSKAGSTAVYNPVTMWSSLNTTIPLTLRGAASQTANLQEWQDSAGTAMAYVRNDGLISTGGSGLLTNLIRANAFTTGGRILVNDASPITVDTTSTTVVPMVVKGVASQTADLQQWRDSSGTSVVRLDPSGRVSILAGTTDVMGTANATLALNTHATGAIGLVIRGRASQTGDLQQWQDSTGAVLGKIDTNGGFQHTSSSADTTPFNTTPNSVVLRNTSSTNGSYNVISGLSNNTIAAGISFRYNDWTNSYGQVFMGTRSASGFNSNAFVLNPGGGLQLSNNVANTTGLIVKGAASQTANLQEWQNSAGTAVANITSDGNFNSPTITATSYLNLSNTTGGIAVQGSYALRASGAKFTAGLTAIANTQFGILVTAAADAGLVIKGAASQTGDLTQWQNSSSSVLAKVDASGNLTAASIIKTGGTSSQFLKADGSVDTTAYAAATHKYHEFVNGTYYFDRYDQPRYFRLFTENAVFDNARYTAVSNVEYYNFTNSTWTAWTGGDAEVKKLLDGRPDTRTDIDHTHRRFRFNITKNSGWPTGCLIAVYTTWTGNTWTNIGLTIEDTADLVTWTTRDTLTFGSANTSGEYGWHAYYDSGNLHNGRTINRVTFDITDWTDNGSYTTKPLNTFSMFSNYDGAADSIGVPVTWDYDKVLKVNNNVIWHAGNDGASSGLDADLLDGNHASAFSLTSHNHSGSYQPLDADLTAIAGLAGTSGLLKKTAADTWALDTTTYSTTTGTVTSVGMTVPTGLSISGSPVTTSGTLAITLTAGYSIPTTTSQTNWDSAYTDRLKWDGGSTGLVAATGRTSLGATTVGSNVFTLTDPSAITFLRINADNTVSALDAATFRTAIGAGTSSTTGTVTSVSMTVPTGLSISGSPITSSGTLALTLTAGYEIPTTAALAAKAPLASPTFTGVPAAPTATAGTNTTQVATTAFVATALSGAGGADPIMAIMGAY